MEDVIKDDDSYMTQYEKQVIIDQEIAKLLSDLPDYRKAESNDKYSLEPITEDKQGKFIHGQKWPIEPTEPTKLKSASRRPIRSTIPPKKPRELKSMLEVTIMEFSNGEWVESDLFSPENEFATLSIPGSPFRLRFPAVELRDFLYKSISTENPGYITFEKGKEKFKIAIEINPQLLNEATIC